jgi:ribonuclease Y
LAIVIGILIGLAAGALAVVLSLRLLGGTRVAAARHARQLMLAEAKREAESLKREAQLETKEESVRLRSELERDLQDRRTETIQAQERLRAKEDEIQRRLLEVDRSEQGIADRETHARQLQEELKVAKDEELKELERVSGLTVNEAKAEVLSRSEELVRHELARPAGGRGTSSPTRCSVSPRATRPRRRSRSSSSRPTT